MKGKFLVGIVVLAVAAFFGYQFLLGQNTSEDENNVKASFKRLSMAISGGDLKTINSIVSPKFSDTKLKKRDDFIKVLTLPRKTYSAMVGNIQMQGDMALVFYQRTEVRGERGKMLRESVKGEIWKKNPANPKEWKLFKLAQGDKWFRSREIPVEVKSADDLEAAKGTQADKVLGTIERKEDAKLAKEEEARARAEEEEGEEEEIMEEPLQLAEAVAVDTSDRYNPGGKRDPFLPAYERPDIQIGKECDPSRPKEFLETYELLSLKLQGVIFTEEDALALVTTPDGKGFTVRRNMYLGKNCGRVMNIEEERLMIKEKKKDPTDPFGDWQSVDSELKLRPEEGT